MNLRLQPLAALTSLGLISAASAAPPAPHFKVIKPLFRTLSHNARGHHAPPPGALQLSQWDGSFTDHTNQTVNYTMVGPDPATSNTTTTIPLVIIPLKMVYGALNGNMTFDPNKTKVSNGKSVTKNLIASPLLKPRVKYVQGGTNVGHTQYVDAYQRANFWSSVKTNRDYHVVLGSPTIMKEQTINVSPVAGMVMTNPFGTEPAGQMEIDLFDQEVLKIIDANPGVITPDVLPLFVTTNVFLTEAFAVCCIGGYHSATAGHPTGQTYAYATYETENGSFSQDVSAFSHEIGEWYDDPFTDNDVNCTDNTLMENGDPLENNANYGSFPYTVNGFTYNLQSLVFLPYFGAPPETSLHSWLSFQNEQQTVCPGQ